MSRKHRLGLQIAFVALLLFCLWLYLPAYHDSFVGDDFVQQWRIREFVRAPAGAWQILSPFWTNWYYRPLQNLWFLGNRLQFGLNPFGYYALQVLVHLLAISLLYRLARFLRLPVWAGFVTAVLFAINGQHQLTVSWISSIAIVLGAVFSLAAADAYFAYLRWRRWVWLILTIVFVLLALLSHEEGVLIAIFLFSVWLTQPQRPSRPRDYVFFALLLGLMSSMVVVQIVRPNVHIAVEGDFFTRLQTAVWPANWGAFGLEVTSRWLGLENQLPDLLSQVAFTTMAGLVFLLLASAAFWAGSRAVRLGLLWAGLHLGFIYLALWAQRPELFDGRHLYNAWVGFSLTLGATLAQLYQAKTLNVDQRSQRQAGLVLTAVILLFTGIHVRAVQAGTARFYQLTRQVKASEADIKAILPELHEGTQLFATRFILTPPYFVPAAGVWYDAPELNGGSLEVFKQHETIPSDFYLIDYEDGRLYNLMPALQDASQTIFLWHNEPKLINAAISENSIAGPKSARQLAVKVTPQANGWAAVQFTAAVPENSRLETAVHGQPGQQFQILIDGEIVFDQTLASSHNEWQEVSIPLDQLGGETITLQFQLRSSPEEPGYWSVPRFVID